MKNFINLVKQFIFWMMFFMVCRTVFLVYTVNGAGAFESTDLLLSYLHGMYLDVSVSCYLLVIPFLLLFLQSITLWKVFAKINTIYSFIGIIVIVLITSSELAIYDEWKKKLNFTAISYLQRPSEVFETVEWGVLLVILVSFTFVSAIGIISYGKFVRQNELPAKRKWIATGLFFLICPVVLLLGIRGGIQQIPINQSSVYFSHNNYINEVAVNSSWNLSHSILNNMKFQSQNPFLYYPVEEASQTVQELYMVEKDTTVSVLNTTHPNIVLLIMESWSANLISDLGGYGELTPNFHEISKEGILFTEIYASGTLSHEGICCLLSGYPALPEVIIIKQPDKIAQLPCINTLLKKEGYSSSFHFGGQLNYGNIKGYIYYNQFDNIIEGVDFSDAIPSGRLGHHDEFLYDRLIADYNTYKEPFFGGAFTLSSHSPFDIPAKNSIKFGGEFENYFSSVYYADSCLGDFLARATETSWYENTLFVIIADHSHHTHLSKGWYSPDARKIPLLLYGNVLKDEFRGTTIDKIGNQYDFPAILLAQLGLSSRDFVWSKNLLNPTVRDFAFYSFDYGGGWVESDSAHFVFDELRSQVWHQYEPDGHSQVNMEKNAKSFLQVVFKSYLDH